MQDFKKFIIWVNYGQEGWSPIDSRDTFEEAAQVYLERKSSEPMIITEYIPVKLVPEKSVIPQTVYRS